MNKMGDNHCSSNATREVHSKRKNNWKRARGHLAKKGKLSPKANDTVHQKKLQGVKCSISMQQKARNY